MKHILLIFLLLSGCVTSSPIKETVTVKMEVEFNLVPDSSYMPCVPDAVGCASPNGRIWVIGREREGRIIFDKSDMGHEVMHLLHWKNSQIADPHLRKE